MQKTLVRTTYIHGQTDGVTEPAAIPAFHWCLVVVGKMLMRNLRMTYKQETGHRAGCKPLEAIARN